MAITVSYGSLDALLGLNFGATALSNLTPTLIDGSITNSSTSTNEVLTYAGLIATVGSEFLAMSSVSFTVAGVSDANDTLTIDAYVGASLIGQLNFTVAGFSGAGIALAAMPLDSLVSQAGNLGGLAGSLFVLGLNSAGATTHLLPFSIGQAYSFNAGAAVHYATAANPVLVGGNGPQMLIALSGNDTLTAGAKRTVIYGGPGNDTLIGGAGNDLIYGGTGNDTIIGGSGSDTLTGGTGTDTIIAGSGRMVMVGGSGTDTFVFAPGDTGGLTTATADAIQHFHAGLGDRIDLSAFDADLPAGGATHVSFIGTNPFDGHAGEFRYTATSTDIVLWGDMTGAGVADVMITMKNMHTLTASQFVL